MATLGRRIRQRFGIATRRVAIRTQLPWYWRWLGLILVAGLSYGVGAWAYDAGRRFAGFDRSELEAELGRLREEVDRLQKETGRLRALANASESRLKVEQTAQRQLAAQVKMLEAENARLREDLAFFESLSPSSGDRVTINRFLVEPDALPGSYRYRMLVAVGGVRPRPFQGVVQLVLHVQAEGGEDTLVISDPAKPESGNFRLNFKYFQRVEGVFQVPPQVRLRSVQVRVLEQGTSQAKAVETVELS